MEASAGWRDPHNKHDVPDGVGSHRVGADAKGEEVTVTRRTLSRAPHAVR